MARKQLSPHFNVSEFDCRDGTKVPQKYHDDLELLCKKFLEKMRQKFGSCHINSGYRTERYNRDVVHGARYSFHVYDDRPPGSGVAADVTFERGSVDDWYRMAKRIRGWKRFGGKGGIGYYPRGGFIHIDTRNYAADWNGP